MLYAFLTVYNCFSRSSLSSSSSPCQTTSAITKHVQSRGPDSATLSTTMCVHAHKGLAMPRARHYGELALAGSRRLRSRLAAGPDVFANAIVVVVSSASKTSSCITHHRFPDELFAPLLALLNMLQVVLLNSSGVLQSLQFSSCNKHQNLNNSYLERHYKRLMRPVARSRRTRYVR